jgi:hypothetical protein
METVIHNVNELSAAGLTAAESLVGHPLAANQQLVIQVVNAPIENGQRAAGIDQDRLPDWCDVYAGLSEERVQEIEKAIARRLDLSRSGA